ncbi:MAG: hypothetical protein OZ921_07305 [Sorangiineae bacterium]|nr:hypothetical protein [Polyangiaceae bacterium]MEB2322303.1 hypothetical protein [Sorangiineae bacterium]
MTTRIIPGGPSTAVASTPTAARVTPPPARPFRQVMSAGASAVIGGAEAAVTRLPGGPVLAAAFRPGVGHAPAVGAGVGAGAGAPDVSAEGSTGTSAAAPGTSVEAALAESADQNLYYLQLQERMQAENRAYTTVSNVLKARHDTVKNAISNIR